VSIIGSKDRADEDDDSHAQGCWTTLINVFAISCCQKKEY